MLDILEEFVAYYLIAGVLLVICTNHFVEDCRQMWKEFDYTERALLLIGWLPILIYVYFFPE